MSFTTDKPVAFHVFTTSHILPPFPPLLLHLFFHNSCPIYVRVQRWRSLWLSALDSSDHMSILVCGNCHLSSAAPPPPPYYYYLYPISCRNFSSSCTPLSSPQFLLSLGSLWICWTSGQNVPPRHTNRLVPCSETKRLSGSLSELRIVAPRGAQGLKEGWGELWQTTDLLKHSIHSFASTL